jgi:multiple sugar transport system substrate-binding protein
MSLRGSVIIRAAFIAAFVFGCSGSGGKAPVRAGKQTTITFWHGMGGPLGDALDSLIASFEKANPDVNVEPVSMGSYSTLSQKLMGAVQVSAPPNMAQMYESWTTQFHQLNKLVPFDSLVRGPDGLSEAELADFYPAFIADNTWDGRLITLPGNKSVPVFFYNIEMLDSAGYKTFPTTWAEFRAMAKKLTDRKQGTWGTAGGVNEWMFGCMLRQQGGDYLDERQGKATFNSAAGVKAAQYMYDMVATDSSAVYGTGYDPQNDFLSGKIACIWGTIVSWTFMKQNMTFPVGIAPVPSEGTPNVLAFGTNIGIFRTGTPQQVAACWRFVKWFTSPPQQAKWAELTFYVPARKSSLKAAGYAKLVAETPGLAAALAQLDYMSFEPRSEAWFKGRRTLSEALERVMRGEASAQQALDAAAVEVEKEMK